jgi:hypothetical protein
MDFNHIYDEKNYVLLEKGVSLLGEYIVIPLHITKHGFQP